MRWWKKILIGFALLLVLLAASLYVLSRRPIPTHIQYGMSFNVDYAKELGLDWKTVYNAILDDLKVRHLRLSATWPLIEPTEGTYDFSALDYELKRADAVGADVILVVGRRTPRWPECHTPTWAAKLSSSAQDTAILNYITAVVSRYKHDPAITYWQVENEPYLGVFATQYCPPLDVKFLDKEIALVRSLDGTRPILITDSGNLGTWYGAYQHGDAFGTSVYVYFTNPHLGAFKTLLPPWFYRVKTNLMQLLYGKKETMLIELSAEPWLTTPIESTPLSEQLARMDLTKFNDILAYAKQTGFQKQYLWGAEWWYWLTQHGHPEMWAKGKTLFQN